MKNNFIFNSSSLLLLKIKKDKCVKVNSDNSVIFEDLLQFFVNLITLNHFFDDLNPFIIIFDTIWEDLLGIRVTTAFHFLDCLYHHFIGWSHTYFEDPFKDYRCWAHVYVGAEVKPVYKWCYDHRCYVKFEPVHQGLRSFVSVKPNNALLTFLRSQSGVRQNQVCFLLRTVMRLLDKYLDCNKERLTDIRSPYVINLKNTLLGNCLKVNYIEYMQLRMLVANNTERYQRRS